MSATKVNRKTWSQLRADIAETFRKWGGTQNWRIESVMDRDAASKRHAGKAGQTLEQRTVTLTFQHFVNEPMRLWADARLTMQRGESALDNLELLAKTAEWMRMADVRGITRPVVKLYRQIYPDQVRQQQPPPPPPPRQERVKSTGPYAVLHIVDDAPLAVAEAAYRALVRDVHPDVGGSHELMVALNAAIHTIRVKQTRSAHG